MDEFLPSIFATGISRLCNNPWKLISIFGHLDFYFIIFSIVPRVGTFATSDDVFNWETNTANYYIKDTSVHRREDAMQ